MRRMSERPIRGWRARPGGQTPALRGGPPRGDRSEPVRARTDEPTLHPVARARHSFWAPGTRHAMPRLSAAGTIPAEGAARLPAPQASSASSTKNCHKRLPSARIDGRMDATSPPRPRPTEEGRARFSALMREHHRELLVFAGAATRDRDAAQDIVQDAFVSAWRKFGDYDESRDFGAWMRGIVRNKIKDWFRARQRLPLGISPDSLEFVELEIDIAAWQEAKSEGSGIFEIVGECVERLPANFKAAVGRYYFEGLDSEQAAAVLEISSANLRKRLERARALLHECIGGKTSAFSQNRTEKSHV